MRTTAYVPRSACTAANEPPFGVPSSTTRSTCCVPGRASAARLTSPPMLCATSATRVGAMARSRAASALPEAATGSRQS